MNWYNTDPVAAELRKIYGETLGNTMDNTMMETVDSVSKGGGARAHLQPAQELAHRAQCLEEYGRQYECIG